MFVCVYMRVFALVHACDGVSACLCACMKRRGGRVPAFLLNHAHQNGQGRDRISPGMFLRAVI